MLKKYLSLTLILLAFSSASVFAQVNIGYMNTQEVLSQLPERQQVREEMNTFMQQKQQELGEQATSYQDAVADFENNRASMSQSQIQQREQELTDMQTSLQELNQSIRLQMQQKRNELLEPILTRIDEAIAAVADSRGLDFVLNKNTQNGENIVFYASDQQVDITQQVLNRLTSNSSN